MRQVLVILFVGIASLSAMPARVSKVEAARDAGSYQTLPDGRVSPAGRACSSVAFNDDAQQDILHRLEAAGSFKSLLRMLKAAGLAEALSRPGANLTLFAPCDEAFAQWPKGKLDVLTRRYVKRLKESLSNHMVAGRYTYRDLLKESHRAGTDFSPGLKTVGGAYLYVLREAAEGEAPNDAGAGPLGLRISEAPNDFNARSTMVPRGNYVYPYGSIVSADVAASNGVIYVIDQSLRLSTENFWGADG